MSKYKTLIGIEMHCEISETNTKVFSGAKNSYNTKSNENVSAVDMAFPGTLPVVNKEAVKKALTASIILNCQVPEYLYFERKNYYYPDLPKGYQITQETKPAPIGSFGELEYICNDEVKKVRINNIHLEEDSASLDHLSDVSLIDYNRAGVPLLELVTEPDLTSSDEVIAFLETMRSIYQYAGISEADAKKGQIRCDVNISIMDEKLDSKDPKNWGTKVEIKNVNSFSSVKEAIEYEIKRQIELKEKGEYDDMLQQTRRFDEETKTTKFMRSKIDAIDYKYFIEPNIPKFKITENWINEIKMSIPPLANERKEKYINKWNIKANDAKVLVKEKAISDYYEKVVNEGNDPIETANWMNTIILGSINKLNVTIDEFFITPEILSEVLKMITNGKISKNQAKNVLYEAVETEKNPLEIIKDNNMEQIEDDSLIQNIISGILKTHEKEVNEYLEKGLTNRINFFLGQVMKESKGQANPAKAMEMLKKTLDDMKK